MHQNRGTHSTGDLSGSGGDCVCDLCQSANDREDGGERAGMFNPDSKIPPFGGIFKVQARANRCTGANRTAPLPGVLE